MKTAAQAAARWTASAGTAQTAWQEGVQGTSKDQAALAVAAIPRMVQGFNQAASSGRIAAGLQRGGTAYWKSQSLAKAGNYGTGIAAGGNNFTAAITKIIAAESQIVGSLPPRGDIGQNLQRANQVAMGLHGLKGQLGAR